ncbi:isoquinoline 1-oxidoreductase subunit beta [Kordiimonas sediminis]|uniref:Isoquinoline 1-oxidoreductase subunit beta n=1 Tax=Kordiimonas sediminis TaxID=1735581 RepID=A0A919E9T5_9PROT|nr:molybdopterin cofactor-binding domain-containing protein [Kordiimonas sediminis]GHF28147.1 isoquinoline 1-oxidoreductase subunit beta [Kordiimonas sediminis]
MQLDRRSFIQTSLLASGGLLLSLSVPELSGTADDATLDSFQANIYLRFNPDGTIVYRDTKPEMGQGVSTGLAMVICDELGADWDEFIIDRPPLTYHMEIRHSLESSAGSNGMLAAYMPLRQAAATLRQLFIECASELWGCAPSDCYVKTSKVYRRSSDDTLEFKDLFKSVAQRKMPESAALKNDSDFDLIGKSLPIVENMAIITGAQQYALDIDMENMVHASIERSPTTDSVPTHIDDAACLNIEGVLTTVKLPAFPYKTDPNNAWQEKYRGTKSGVAVIGRTTWHAIKGREALKVQWSSSQYQDHDDNRIKSEMLAIPDEKIRNVASFGDTAREIQKAAPNRLFQSRYYNPYQENAQLEPLNAVADYDGKTLTIWAGSQSPTLALAYVAEITGVTTENIVIHPMRSGGGFGRRYFYDFIAEAGFLAVTLKRPVKVTWTREDCIKHSRYHLARYDEHTLVLDDANNPVAWDSLTRSGSNYGWLGRNIMLDYYAGCTAHRATRHAESESLVLYPGSWRSVDAHPVGLARECFIDEVAAAIGKDPLHLRQQWLSQKAIQHEERGLDEPALQRRLDRQERLLSILKYAEKTAGWRKNLNKNQGKGISLSYFYGTYVCQIAYVSKHNETINVDKIICFFDCGKVVNPQLVTAQIEGSIVWALSALINPAIKVENGMVTQSNFHDYPIIRMDEIPEIEIHLLNSNRAPNRVGEAAVPDTAPAILNAVYNLTGKRHKELPMTLGT